MVIVALGNPFILQADSGPSRPLSSPNLPLGIRLWGHTSTYPPPPTPDS